MAPVIKKADVMLRVKQRAIVSLVVLLLVGWLKKIDWLVVVSFGSFTVLFVVFFFHYL